MSAWSTSAAGESSNSNSAELPGLYAVVAIVTV